MEKEERKLRKIAITRYLKGESPQHICSSLGRSRFWLFKWLHRWDPDEPKWFYSLPRKAYRIKRTDPDMEKAIIEARGYLERQNMFCGAQSILWHLEQQGMDHLPSVSTVNRIVKRNRLVKRRKGPYQPKGKPYPHLPTDKPNMVHHGDYLGPRYLEGPIRFYCLSCVDVATKRAAFIPVPNRVVSTSKEALWLIWLRLGIPKFLQLDNELAFRGSNRHPRASGGLIRLCLHCGVEPVFIPFSEPWRNYAVESFHNHLQQKWLRRVNMKSWSDLHREALLFEQKHNSRYRYSKLKGMSPTQALENTKASLRFPETLSPPDRIPKPQKGRVHLIRFIRGNLKLDIFGEQFSVAPELAYEYLRATIDVKEQKLKLYKGKYLVQSLDYYIP